VQRLRAGELRIDHAREVAAAAEQRAGAEPGRERVGRDLELAQSQRLSGFVGEERAEGAAQVETQRCRQPEAGDEPRRPEDGARAQARDVLEELVEIECDAATADDTEQ
jgi:hypothetical protein